MLFFRKQEREAAVKVNAAKVQAIRKDTFKSIDKVTKKMRSATNKTEKLTRAMDDWGTTELIFFATHGGDNDVN